MLIISRKLEESIKIGDNIEIKILGVVSDKAGAKNRAASIGIEAPREITVLRRELVDTQRENVAAAIHPAAALPLSGIAELLKQRRALPASEDKDSI